MHLYHYKHYKVTPVKTIQTSLKEILRTLRKSLSLFLKKIRKFSTWADCNCKIILLTRVMKRHENKIANNIAVFERSLQNHLSAFSELPQIVKHRSRRVENKHQTPFAIIAQLDSSIIRGHNFILLTIWNEIQKNYSK